jgi:hypothetical protein
MGTDSGGPHMCIPCPEGTFSEMATNHCLPCDLGFEPNQQKSDCQRCPDNHITPDHGSVCEPCPIYTLSNKIGNACLPADKIISKMQTKYSPYTFSGEYICSESNYRQKPHLCTSSGILGPITDIQ